MKCPACQVEMAKRDLDFIEIDECPSCNGVWFDSDELRRAKDETAPDLAWLDFDLWKDADRFELSERSRQCPRCRVPMATVAYGQTGVEVDCCAHCKGVWLDAAEFGRIIGALTREMDSMPVKDYVRSALQEAGEIATGDEGLASEWHDFATVMRLLTYRFFVENPCLADKLRAFQEQNPIR